MLIGIIKNKNSANRAENRHDPVVANSAAAQQPQGVDGHDQVYSKQEPNLNIRKLFLEIKSLLPIMNKIG